MQPDADAGPVSETGPGETGLDGPMADGPAEETEPPPDGPVCTATVAINEIQTQGVEADDEFVELVNAGSCAVQMDDFALYYRSATGTTDLTLWTAASGQKLGPDVFFVLGGAAYSGVKDFDIAAGASLAAAGGTLSLKKGAKTIDLVGWGSALYVDSAPAPAPAASKSIGRHPDGADTDSNAADFTEGTPTPRKANQ